MDICLHNELLGLTMFGALKYVRPGGPSCVMTEPSTFEVETNEKFNKVKPPAADHSCRIHPDRMWNIRFRNTGARATPLVEGLPVLYPLIRRAVKLIVATFGASHCYQLPTQSYQHCSGKVKSVGGRNHFGPNCVWIYT